MKQNVLITGGSRGIGAAAVLAFARAGYGVAFTWNAHANAAQEVLVRARQCNPDGIFPREVFPRLDYPRNQWRCLVRQKSVANLQRRMDIRYFPKNAVGSS